MFATRVARRLTGRTFTSTSSLFNIDMVAEHTFKPGTELMEHPIDEPSKGGTCNNIGYTAGSRSDLRWMEHQTPPKIK